MDFFSNHKKGILIFSVILITVTAITTFFYRTNATFAENVLAVIITPVQRGIAHATGFFDGKFGFMKDAGELSKENQELLEQVNELKAENDRLKLAEKENKQLSDLLDVAQKYAEYDTIGTRIIAKDPGIWYDKFIIDKGLGDGLTENMLVLGTEGLCGVIVKTGKHHAQVLSLLDDTSALSVMNARTEDIGILHGDYELKSKFLLKIDYFNADSQILEGDEIITSHVSGYPAGIKIGYVTEVSKDLNGLTKYAIVKPYTDFRHLDTLVVINKPYMAVNISEEE